MLWSGLSGHPIGRHESWHQRPSLSYRMPSKLEAPIVIESTQDLANMIRFSTDYLQSLGGAQPGTYVAPEVCEYFSGPLNVKDLGICRVGLPRGWTSLQPLKMPKAEYFHMYPGMASQAGLNIKG